MKEYFAGINTGDGFVNCLPYAVSGIEKLWILKGCPGCGKSSFIKKIVAEAKERGIEAELIRCSSDVSSLDGAVIPGMSFAVVDGTAPHVMDASCPLYKQTEISLTEFADVNAENAERALSLSSRKKHLFGCAYAALAASNRMRDLLRAVVTPYIDTEKLKAFASRVAKRLPSTAGETAVTQCCAFTSEGVVTLQSFPEDVQTLFFDSDFDIADLFFSLLLEFTEGRRRVISYDATYKNRVCALYFPDAKTLFTSLKTDSAKRINPVRFVSRAGIKATRETRRNINFALKTLYSSASGYMSGARLLHTELESLYSPAMDFASLNVFEAKLIKKLFG